MVVITGDMQVSSLDLSHVALSSDVGVQLLWTGTRTRLILILLPTPRKQALPLTLTPTHPHHLNNPRICPHVSLLRGCRNRSFNVPFSVSATS